MSYRTAFITGASSGIGHAVALRLAKEGTDVAIAARRGEALEALADEIRRAGGSARTFPLDVASTEATVETIQRADDEMDGIDLVVANAGVGVDRWAGKLRWEDCRPVVDVNVRGATATLTALLRRMAKRGSGHLVGVSSLAGYRGLPRNAAYSASKAYLATFLESLRMDMRSVGVAVTDVRPGFVKTPMTDKNEFPMPFLMDLDDAVDIIMRGIHRRDAVVAFPWQLATLVRSSTMLPAGLWDMAATRARGG